MLCHVAFVVAIAVPMIPVAVASGGGGLDSPYPNMARHGERQRERLTYGQTDRQRQERDADKIERDKRQKETCETERTARKTDSDRKIPDIKRKIE